MSNTEQNTEKDILNEESLNTEEGSFHVFGKLFACG